MSYFKNVFFHELLKHRFHSKGFNILLNNPNQANYVFNVRCTGYHALNRSSPRLTYGVAYHSDVALPFTGGAAFENHTKSEQERVRSPLAVS
jgi:hypothetical protein